MVPNFSSGVAVATANLGMKVLIPSQAIRNIDRGSCKGLTLELAEIGKDGTLLAQLPAERQSLNFCYTVHITARPDVTVSETSSNCLFVIHVDENSKIDELKCLKDCDLTVIIYDSEEFNSSIVLHQKRLTGKTDSLTTSILSGFKEEKCTLYPKEYPCALLRSYYQVIKRLLPPEKLESKSYTVSEIRRKHRNVEYLASKTPKLCTCAHSFRCWAYVCQYVMDLLLGLLLLTLILLYGSLVSKWIISYAEIIVVKMMDLLEWMMGVPAGLKLNYNLTVFLGKFFSYHVWIWAGYLRLVTEYFLTILKMLFVLGLVGGSSLQIAMLQDFFGVLTLHLFCFYIYSARLYSLFVQSSWALWRLFRGKKWNTLRHRVDHASYDVTQLFIGTLLFAILLFLLPTTLLYYSVFTMFRMIVLAVQGLLQYLRSSLSYLYLLIYFMCITDSKYLKDEYRLCVSPSSSGRTTVVFIENLAVVDYYGAVDVLKLPHDTTRVKLIEIFNKLFKGEII